MAGANWSDLGLRAISALVLGAIGGLAIYAGGAAFVAFVLICVAAMIWELARMIGYRKRAALLLGVTAGCAFLCVILAPLPYLSLPLAALPGLAMGLGRAPGLRWQAGFYALAVVLAGVALLQLRAFGAVPLLWLLLVVVSSDLAGYFAGRALGGAKFWPAISPKKTWSGTVAGWVAAAGVGLGFVLLADAPWGILLLSPIIAFAGQLGDILESLFKRRAGVKDSSNLIPGHGGFLDRFDALLIAALLAMVMGLALELPLPKGL